MHIIILTYSLYTWTTQLDGTWQYFGPGRDVAVLWCWTGRGSALVLDGTWQYFGPGRDVAVLWCWTGRGSALVLDGTW